ncbi:MAG: hypothetical protein QP772_08505, partial [Actinomycetaceae bacterium UMB1218B]|nr:hypothetical protein [Actinomycetaceae bacterium UMB1218B]
SQWTCWAQKCFIKMIAIHGIVHIQSRTTPTEGLRFLTGADHGYCEIRRRIRQINLQSATAPLQVISGGSENQSRRFIRA